MKKITIIVGITALGLLSTAVLLTAIQRDHTRTTPPYSETQKLAVTKSANAPVAHNFTATATPSAANTSRDLSPTEIQIFIKDVDRTFAGLMVAGVNEEEINKSLSRLNERREAGARALLKILASVPTHEGEVRERISMVDYLVYRSRWDEDTRTEMLKLATNEVPASTPQKIKGAMIVERSEMIGRMAALDWNATSQALQSLNHPSARRVAAAEAVFALAEQGMPLDEARKKVKEVVPEYIIASQNNARRK